MGNWLGTDHPGSSLFFVLGTRARKLWTTGGAGVLGNTWGGGGGGIPPIVSTSTLEYLTNSFCADKPVLPRTAVRATTARNEDDSALGLHTLATRGILGSQDVREPSGTPRGNPRGIPSAAKHPTEAQRISSGLKRSNSYRT